MTTYPKFVAYSLLLTMFGAVSYLPGPTVVASPYGASTTATPNPVIENQPTSITTNITNGGSTLQGAIVDIEVYSASNQKVWQQFVTNQTLVTNTPAPYQFSWTPQSPGNYTVKVGVFNANWSVNYFWQNNAATISVASPPAATTITGNVSVWWPTSGVTLSGVQPFKALLDGANVSTYDLYWQVDGGVLNTMADNYVGYPHKEALVNLSTWNWRGNGPYLLTFVAKNKSGTVLNTKQIPIYVQTTTPTTQTPAASPSSNTSPSQPTPSSAAINPPVTSGVTFTINPTVNAHPISPYIYGTNFGDNPNYWDGASRNLTFARFGGNRLTTYNWENNASNAGIDWQHQSDGYLGGGDTPGEAVKGRVAQAQAAGAATLVTIPMQGYVAADKKGDGDVQNTPNYLSTRFRQTKPTKGSSLESMPNLSDGAVYQDEFVDWLEKKFPNAKIDATKKIFYSLDNEPDLWSSSHPRLQTQPLTYDSLIEKTINFAGAIKKVAPHGLVFGAANYGYNGWQTLQNAPDANGRNFLDVYLDNLKSAEQTHGRRLLDVLDIHWYPEAQGGGRRITADDSDTVIADAREQAPRSLWDPSYKEDSWIANSIGGPIALIPTLKNKIAAHYPGTKLAITEYYFGGGADISGTIAQADALGIFGRENLFAANLWHVGATDDRFIYAGLAMFRNFDGKNSTFGSQSISAVTTDNSSTSVYASTDPNNPGRITMVAINKARTALPVNINIATGNLLPMTQATGYRVTAASATPQSIGAHTVANGSFGVTLPAQSVTTYVITP